MKHIKYDDYDFEEDKLFEFLDDVIGIDPEKNIVLII